MASYTVFDEGQTIRGDARQVLESIRAENARENDEIAGMSVEDYAKALIEDAPYFLPDDLLDALTRAKFESDYDRALAYLSQMPTSGVRILTVQNGQP
jgi:hypothetical protein